MEHKKMEGNMTHMKHDMHKMKGEHKGHENHHKMMAEDFKKRFKISVILTIQTLTLRRLSFFKRYDR